jgi:hypothetical protein
MMQVKVYFNLHKKCYSIQHKGIVIGHADEVYLTDCEFKVSKAGRERVLREKRKNVHAFITGKLSEGSLVYGTNVTYNPYKYETFVDKATELPIVSAKSAFLFRGGVLASL